MSATPSTLLPIESSSAAGIKSAANGYSIATNVLAVLGAGVAAIAMSRDPIFGLFVAALLCGWAEVDGLCGGSHVGALTPLRALDSTHGLWFRAASAYTIGGVVTASVVGLTIGLLGAAAADDGLQSPLAFTLLAVGASILALRELGLLNFSLPQVHRQTDKMWALRFGFVTGAAMWGSHIGLGFATVIKHGGLFVVAAAALLLHPWQSALLFVAFWIGRTLPIWATPRLTGNESDGSKVTDMLLARPTPYRICALAGLLAFALAALLLADRSL